MHYANVSLSGNTANQNSPVLLVRLTSWDFLALYTFNKSYIVLQIKCSVSDLQREIREFPRPSAISLQSWTIKTLGTHHLFCQ